MASFGTGKGAETIRIAWAECQANPCSTFGEALAGISKALCCEDIDVRMGSSNAREGIGRLLDGEKPGMPAIRQIRHWLGWVGNLTFFTSGSV